MCCLAAPEHHRFALPVWENPVTTTHCMCASQALVQRGYQSRELRDDPGALSLLPFQLSAIERKTSCAAWLSRTPTSTQRIIGGVGHLYTSRQMWGHAAASTAVGVSSRHVHNVAGATHHGARVAGCCAVGTLLVFYASYKFHMNVSS